jgi:hypothetical protein
MCALCPLFRGKALNRRLGARATEVSSVALKGKVRTMTEETWVTETWVYAGIRVGYGGKRMHGWRDPSGEEHLYSDKGYFVIGGLYEVKVDRKSESLTRKTPQYTGDMLSRVECGALEAKDYAARQRLAALAQERSDAKRSELDRALEPLLAIAAKADYASRDAIVAYATRKIYQARVKEG